MQPSFVAIVCWCYQLTIQITVPIPANRLLPIQADYGFKGLHEKDKAEHARMDGDSKPISAGIRPVATYLQQTQWTLM